MDATPPQVTVVQEKHGITRNPVTGVSDKLTSDIWEDSAGKTVLAGQRLTQVVWHNDCSSGTTGVGIIVNSHLFISCYILGTVKPLDSFS